MSTKEAEKKAILVQGSGRFGLAITESVIKDMPPNTILRTGYTKEQEKNLPRLQKTGTEPICVDLNDEKSISASLKDVRDVVLIPPFAQNREELCKNFIDKAITSGVSRCILISVQGAGPGGEFPWAKQLYNVEQKLIKSGMNYTILRTSIHQETFLLEKEALKSGSLFLPTGDAKFAPASYKDVTDLCAVLLKHPDKGINKIWDITGPVLYNGNEVARMIEDTIGKKVNFVSVSADDFKNKLKSWGVNDVKAESLGDLLDWYGKGKGTRLFTDYSVFLGRDSTLLRDLITEHKNELM